MRHLVAQKPGAKAVEAAESFRDGPPPIRRYNADAVAMRPTRFELATFGLKDGWRRARARRAIVAECPGRIRTGDLPLQEAAALSC